MNKYISLTLIVILAIVSIGWSFNTKYNGSPTAVVVAVGAHIKSKDVPIVNKYKRKDCPVCKGTGKYRSGDGIEEVVCGYCEE